MPPRPFILALIILAASGAALVPGWQEITRQRQERAAIVARIRTLNTQLAGQRRELKTFGENTMIAEAQLQKLQAAPPAAPPPPNPAREADAAYWLARYTRLKQLFVTRGDLATPELRLLSDTDWLSLAKRSKFDTDADIRRAMGSARSLATKRLLAALLPGVRALGRPENPNPPTSMTAFAAYLDDPALRDLLPRLELVAASPTPETPAWEIRPKVRLDPDYEPALSLHSDGRSSMTELPLP